MIKNIQELNKCSKEKCKKEYEIVINNKKLKLEKEKLFQEKDLKKKEQLINNIFSNINQNNLDLCIYKKCKIQKQLIEYRIKSIKDKINFYNIKFPKYYQDKYDNFMELSSKKSFNDEEYLKLIILFQILQRFISIKITEINKPFIKSYEDYINCGMNKCNDLYKNTAKDENLSKKKISTYSIKDDNKRNKVIREVYSNEKQVQLDKCITNKCNKASLKLIQETLKVFNKKIKYFKIKIPDNLKLPDIKKITEDDIPELIIKLNQLGRYIDKNEYIANI